MTCCLSISSHLFMILSDRQILLLLLVMFLKIGLCACIHMPIAKSMSHLCHTGNGRNGFESGLRVTLDACMSNSLNFLLLDYLFSPHPFDLAFNSISLKASVSWSISAIELRASRINHEFSTGFGPTEYIKKGKPIILKNLGQDLLWMYRKWTKRGCNASNTWNFSLKLEAHNLL